MKYFTPDLYCRFASEDDAIADQADNEWEEAIKAYNHSLSGIILPKNVQKLRDMNLHDAKIIALLRQAGDMLVINISKDGKSKTIIYILWDKFRRTTYENFVVSDQPQWLYDEIEVVEEGYFWHRIMTSNGEVIEIPFSRVYFEEMSF